MMMTEIGRKEENQLFEGGLGREVVFSTGRGREERRFLHSAWWNAGLGTQLQTFFFWFGFVCFEEKRRKKQMNKPPLPLLPGRGFYEKCGCVKKSGSRISWPTHTHTQSQPRMIIAYPDVPPCRIRTRMGEERDKKRQKVLMENQSEDRHAKKNTQHENSTRNPSRVPPFSIQSATPNLPRTP